MSQKKRGGERVFGEDQAYLKPWGNPSFFLGSPHRLDLPSLEPLLLTC